MKGRGPIIVPDLLGHAPAEINHGNTASRFMAPMRLCDHTFLRKGSPTHTHLEAMLTHNFQGHCQWLDAAVDG